MEPGYAELYIVELVRVLAPCGYLEFDVPSEHGFFGTAGARPPRPASAYLAEIELVYPPTLTPGAHGLVRADVANVGTETWCDADLKIGNYLARADGSILVRDDARVAVRSTLGTR